LNFIVSLIYKMSRKASIPSNEALLHHVFIGLEIKETFFVQVIAYA